MIFVDTSGWYASAVPTDSDHAAAVAWLGRNTQPLLTTDYIVDETLTLLRARGETRRAMTLGEQFFAGSLAVIYYVTEEDVHLAWETFRQFSDKEWSFTDCTSKVVMEKLHVTQAFAFDHHFHQFGSIHVMP